MCKLGSEPRATWSKTVCDSCHKGALVCHCCALSCSLNRLFIQKVPQVTEMLRLWTPQQESRQTIAVFIFWITLPVCSKRYLLFHNKNCICLEMFKFLCSEMFKLYKVFFKMDLCGFIGAQMLVFKENIFNDFKNSFKTIRRHFI